MNLRRTLGHWVIGHSVIAGVLALGVTSCGDDESGTVTTPDAGNTLAPTNTSEASSGAAETSTSTESTADGVESSTAPITTTSVSSEGSVSTLTSDTSSVSTSAPSSSSNPVLVDTSSESVGSETTVVVEPCDVPPFSVFTRSDTNASWDDNDFSSVVVDASQCPPAVFVDATWPHEEGWENADPSEANHEQTHFTLDSYGANNLVDKEITATIELVADERGSSANAGGYLVSIVSVSTFDRVTVIEPTVEPGVDAGALEPETITETGYSEAESPLEERALLRQVGDQATIRFRLPAKTEAVDSYDPARVLKINLRFYNEYEVPVVEPPSTGTDAGADAGNDAGTYVDGGLDAGHYVGLDGGNDGGIESVMVSVVNDAPPAPVYDYLTSRFAITKFEVSDVGGTPAQ